MGQNAAFPIGNLAVIEKAGADFGNASARLVSAPFPLNWGKTG